MQSPFFHPAVVHLPIALGVLMPLVAGGVLLAWWRGWLPHRAWIGVTLLQLLLVASGVVALRTGEVDEERVEAVVAESAVEAHEEAAELFVGASAGVLVVMLAAAAIGARRSGMLAAGAATVGTLAVLGLGYRTGQAGGSLVYEHGAARAHVTASSSAADVGARDDDD